MAGLGKYSMGGYGRIGPSDNTIMVKMHKEQKIENAPQTLLI